MELWKVKGDHPILARPDQGSLTRAEAEAYANSLRALGYENVSITRDVRHGN